MANPEKSVVDSLDKVRYAGGIEEVVRVIYHAMILYSKKYSKSLIQRLGFLLDFVNAKLPDNLRKILLENKGSSPVYLDSKKRWGSSGKFHKDWNIICNVPINQLKSEIEIR